MDKIIVCGYLEQYNDYGANEYAGLYCKIEDGMDDAPFEYTFVRRDDFDFVFNFIKAVSANSRIASLVEDGFSPELSSMVSDGAEVVCSMDVNSFYDLHEIFYMLDSTLVEDYVSDGNSNKYNLSCDGNVLLEDFFEAVTSYTRLANCAMFAHKYIMTFIEIY